MRWFRNFSIVAGVALVATAAGLRGMAADQSSAQKPSVPAAVPPPAPAVPPPLASHADPKAPVPTNPPEQIAPPAALHDTSGSHGASAGSAAERAR